MREYITKHAKVITTIGVVVMILGFIVILLLTNYKQKTDKELQKRFIFCQDKKGVVFHNFVCSATGECVQQFLQCDFLNYLQNNKIVNLQTIDYEKMTEEFKLRFNVDANFVLGFDNVTTTTK